jgi:predicted DNA-binding transcriptional regulator AlpA
MAGQDMPKGNRRRRSTTTPIAAYSVKEFCDAHGMSISFYYVLKKRKEAPREMRIGRRILISQEAAATWRAERER